LANQEKRRLRGIAKQIGLLKLEIIRVKLQAKKSFLIGILIGAIISILINFIFLYLGIF